MYIILTLLLFGWSGMFLPQRFQMEELHASAPTATLVLNLRPARDWVKSVTHWFGLGGRFLTRFKINHRTVKDRHQVLEKIYNNHSQFIRDFSQQHPSMHLLEVDITSENAGQVLADAFGLEESCWGIHNQNIKRAEGGRQNKNVRSP
jgi:hypothetical protein